jgi:hypothetical protein
MKLSSKAQGLISKWAKDDSFASKTINARAETISGKAAFKEAFRLRRCTIPATGFYESAKKGEHAKQPFYFYLKDKDVFGFAGLWEEWTDKQSGELVETCTIITTEANEVLEPVYDRMPVILKAKDYDLGLDEKEKNTNRERLYRARLPFFPFGKTKTAKRKIGLTRRVSEILQKIMKNLGSKYLFVTDSTGAPITTLKTARLGHASVVLTLDTYSHVLPDMQKDATSKLGQVLFG